VQVSGGGSEADALSACLAAADVWTTSVCETLPLWDTSWRRSNKS